MRIPKLDEVYRLKKPYDGIIQNKDYVVNDVLLLYNEDEQKLLLSIILGENVRFMLEIYEFIKFFNEYFELVEEK